MLINELLKEKDNEKLKSTTIEQQMQDIDQSSSLLLASIYMHLMKNEYEEARKKISKLCQLQNSSKESDNSIEMIPQQIKTRICQSILEVIDIKPLFCYNTRIEENLKNLERINK